MKTPKEERQDKRDLEVHRRHPEHAKNQHHQNQPADLRLVGDPKRNQREKVGGSPQDQRKGLNADEMLEERLREMLNQDKQLRSQLKMLEDENFGNK